MLLAKTRNVRRGDKSFLEGLRSKTLRGVRLLKNQTGLSKISACDILNHREGSHSGLVRAPAKRLPWETGVEGSNPSPSAN